MSDPAIAAAKRATDLAERYGETLVRISELLNDESLTLEVRVLRVRMELVKLDQAEDPCGPKPITESGRDV